ncbi:MAG: hypothetical protein IT369_14870 [Candidatus Latescibacteria bacterium]|nr:hypothetical protein [Candidatus Latescibacterota bacterium]
MLIVLAILLGLGLALLLLPVLIALRVEHPGPAGSLNLRLNWGFALGAAGLQLRLQDQVWQLRPLLLGLALPFPRLQLGGGGEQGATPRTPPPQAEPPPVATADPTPSASAAPPSPKVAGRAALGRFAGDAARPVWRLLRRLAGTLRWRWLRLEGRFGLADPAATGQVFGYLQAVRGVLPRRLRLQLSPDFVRQGVRGSAHLAVHFHLGKALYLVVSFAARMAWRWWGLRRAARRPGPAPSPPSPRR